MKKGGNINYPLHLDGTNRQYQVHNAILVLIDERINIIFFETYDEGVIEALIADGTDELAKLKNSDEGLLYSIFR